MAKDQDKVTEAGNVATGNAPANGGGKIVRVRKNYGYEMSADEKFCLRTVLNAKNACALIAEKIKRGNPISAEVLTACSTLSGEAGRITQG